MRHGINFLLLLHIGSKPNVFREQTGKLNAVVFRHTPQNSQRGITLSRLISLNASDAAFERLGRFLLRKASLGPCSLENILRVRTAYMIRFFSCKNRLLSKMIAIRIAVIILQDSTSDVPAISGGSQYFLKDYGVHQSDASPTVYAFDIMPQRATRFLRHNLLFPFFFSPQICSRHSFYFAA